MANGQSTTPKQGMPTWAKALIGCGCLLLLIGAGVVAASYWGIMKVKQAADDPIILAELLLKASPELEVVREKSGDGKITVRNTQTGEEGTLDIADIKNGNFTFQDKNGQKYDVSGNPDAPGGLTVTGADGQTTSIAASTSLDDVPSWVPIYPNHASLEAGYRTEQADSVAGLLSLTTADSFDTVKSWYEQELKGKGFDVTSTVTPSFGNTRGALIVGQGQDGRSINIALTADGDKISAAINYNGKV
jgi:hypothetical protein